MWEWLIGLTIGFRVQGLGWGRKTKIWHWVPLSLSPLGIVAVRGFRRSGLRVCGVMSVQLFSSGT